MKTYKLSQEEETQIFINTSGGITIEQSSCLGEDSQIVAFGSKERVDHIIKILRELSKNNDWGKEQE